MSIAICGCGPAGLAAALLLARAEHRVCVFDQFETPRPVGSGLILQPTGLAVLEELGLHGQIARLGARIERLYGRVVPSQRIVLDVQYAAIGAGWHAVAIHRAALFRALYDAVREAGVEITTDTRVARAEPTIRDIALFAQPDRCVGRFDLIVDALGANSPLAAGKMRRTVLGYGALWTTVPWPEYGAFRADALEQRYRRANRMAGVLPIGRRTLGGARQATFFWSLKRSDEVAWRTRGIAAWKADVVGLWPEVEPLLAGVSECDQLTFARYDHFTLAKPYGNRVVHIGDAAHSTSPQLGQGANMALLDALALRRALSAEADLATALPHYAAMRYWHVRLFQAASAIFTPFYQSDGRVLPMIRDRIAAPLSRLPIGDAVVARLVSGMTTPPLGRAQHEKFTPHLVGVRGTASDDAIR
jgi:2-polyprenyl-6-methoxyphenol hydroxylase-like FAD-dependent oxidoreductase